MRPPVQVDQDFRDDTWTATYGVRHRWSVVGRGDTAEAAVADLEARQAKEDERLASVWARCAT
jgi:hypothetical protein